jgi:hypothetical protein
VNQYTVRYQIATYSGRITVWADAEEQALAIARQRLRKHVSLPMYYEHYAVER